jgi:ABC-type multidrug transport system permease subunit
MLGGFLEYNSMYFGFRFLYVLALIMYGCAFLGSIGLKLRFARRPRVCAG